jgi:hypothetical protein
LKKVDAPKLVVYENAAAFTNNSALKLSASVKGLGVDKERALLVGAIK